MGDTTRATELVLPVAGMTCRSCEQRVSGRLARLPGVEVVSVSAKAGSATLLVSPEVGEDQLEKAVRAAGYEVARRRWLSPDPSVWLTAVATAAVVLLLAYLAWSSGLWDVVASLPGSGSGLLVVAAVGVAAGLSTCMATVGGLVVAVSATWTAAGGSRLSTVVAPQLWFNAGRVVGFTVLGAALGAVGAVVMVPGWAAGLMVLAAGLVMLFLGLRLSGVSPRLAAVSVSLPGTMTPRLSRWSLARTGPRPLRAALAGAATFFLPCGFTQAVQLYAVSTGSAATAAATMGVFALGTAPGLLALGGLAGFTAGSSSRAWVRALGVVVCLFAVVNVVVGVRGVGVALPAAATPPSAAAPEAVTANVSVSGGVQTIRVRQHEVGYAPQDTVAYAGLPTRWVVTSMTVFSCAASLSVPALGITDGLQAGENVFEIPPQDAGSTIPYSCLMGMYTGSLRFVPGAPA